METKRIENKREVIDVTEVYVAVDGTEFADREECEKYEKSALGVLKGRLHKIALFEGTEYDVFNGAGCEDNDAYVVAPKNEDEVKTVQQVAHLLSYGDWKKKNAEKVAVGKVLVVMFSYNDDNAWIVDLDELVKDATGGKYGIAPVEAK